MDEDTISEETKEIVKRLDKSINDTFRGMTGIFLIMKEYSISREEMGVYIAEIVGCRYKGSSIDMHVYDSIVAALSIFPIDKK